MVKRINGRMSVMLISCCLVFQAAFPVFADGLMDRIQEVITVWGCEKISLEFNISMSVQNESSDKGVKQNALQNISELLSLAESGENLDARVFLGFLYLIGVGEEDNSEKGFEWIRSAAELGNTNAQQLLGIMYLQGDGEDSTISYKVSQDYELALGLFRKAALQGDAQAQLNLGNIYFKGEVVEFDEAEAFRWWRKSAEQGYPSALCRMGTMYYSGRGVEQDKSEAFRLFSEAAEKEHPEAMTRLGVMHYLGETVSADLPEALELWISADQKNEPSAAFCIGAACEIGEFVDKDMRAAVWYYTKALKEGYKPARQELERLGIPADDNSESAEDDTDEEEANELNTVFSWEKMLLNFLYALPYVLLFLQTLL